MTINKCKICRRLKTKLFLKGERCGLQKCAVVRKPYPPGQKSKKRTPSPSEYAKELAEKQKLRNWYGLRENQFSGYVKAVLGKRGKVQDASVVLIASLERRLDNVVFRLGFASQRAQARQIVGHRHFMVNGRAVNIPSFQVKKGDIIQVAEKAKQKPFFKNAAVSLKKYQPPSWLKLDAKDMKGEVIGSPSLQEAAPPVEISAIFEYYSR